MSQLTKNALAKIWRACIEFEMIKENDHILIGLSGGKDSMFMTWALTQIKKYAPFPFQLSAYTLDPAFAASFPAEKLTGFCQRLGISYQHELVNIAAIIAQTGKSPCFTCAYFRRGATARVAKEIGANKIALAHHGDDAVETFLMNITTSGQLKTFLPVTWLSQQKLHVIRPLLYFREQEIKDYIMQLGFEPLKNPCPHNGLTMRQQVKETIVELEKLTPKIYENLFAAMRQADNLELWPGKLNQTEARDKFINFWQKTGKR